MEDGIFSSCFCMSCMGFTLIGVLLLMLVFIGENFFFDGVFERINGFDDFPRLLLQYIKTISLLKFVDYCGSALQYCLHQRDLAGGLDCSFGKE